MPCPIMSTYGEPMPAAEVSLDQLPDDWPNQKAVSMSNSTEIASPPVDSTILFQRQPRSEAEAATLQYSPRKTRTTGTSNAESGSTR